MEIHSSGLSSGTLILAEQENTTVRRIPVEGMSRKRRRDTGTIDTQMVELYEDLSNENEEIRLKAAQSLLRKASLDATPSKEHLTDILGRLVRGLCSGRKAARLGFSVAFTEFVVQILKRNGQAEPDGLNLSDTIDCLEKQTDVAGNVTGQVSC